MRKSKFLLFAARKIGGGLITIFLVMSILFFLLHLLPGGDMVTRTAPFASTEVKNELRERWGLNEPLHIQYIYYLKHVFTLDYKLVGNQEQDALDILLVLFPFTFMLFGTATILSYVFGTFLGIRLLSGGNEWLKTAISGISIFLHGIPAFVLAIFLKNWLVFRYNIFPPATMTVTFQFVDIIRDKIAAIESMTAFIPEMILPLIVLVLVGLARPLLLLRDHMALLVNEPFVLTARAKGLSESAVLSKHVARSALLPLLNDASINMAYIVSGGILIEYIFNWPGIGSVLFGALKIMNYPIISAGIFLLTLILIFFTFLADILNAYLDPRVSS